MMETNEKHGIMASFKGFLSRKASVSKPNPVDDFAVKRNEKPNIFSKRAVDLQGFVRHKLIHTKQSKRGLADFSNAMDVTTKAREATNQTLQRMTFDKLLEMYAQDPIAQAGTNIYATALREVIRPHMIRCSPACRTKIVEDMLYSFRFRDAIDKWVRHFCIFGNAYSFPSPSYIDTKQFYAGDPRIYEFIKDGNYNVKTSNGIIPYGFQLSVYDPALQEEQKREYKYDEDIFHLCINQLSYCDYGWGYVELMYDQITQRNQLSDGRTARTKRQGSGVPVVFYGTERFPPSPKLKIQAAQIRDDLYDETTQAMTIPSTLKVSSLDEELKYGSASETLTTEDYLNTLSAGVLGIPLSILVMTSDKKEAGKTLDYLLPFFEWNLKYIGERLRIDDQLTLWAHRNGFPKEQVHIDWGSLLPGTIKEEVMRVYRMGKIEALPEYKSVMNYILNTLRIPYDIMKQLDDIKPPEYHNPSPSKAAETGISQAEIDARKKT